MKTMRIMGLAGLVLTSGILSGCWTDNCNCFGGSKTTLPPASQNPTAATATTQQPVAWSDPPKMQQPVNVGQQAVGIRQQVDTQPLGTMDTSTGARSSAISGLVPAGGSQVNPPNGGTAPGLRDLNTTPPPLSQRETVPLSNPITAPQPPASMLPPPPPPLPPVTPPTTSSSNYPGAPPMQPLPGQSKIPVLPQGGPGPVE
jgi:hypothetical protein